MGTCARSAGLSPLPGPPPKGSLGHQSTHASRADDTPPHSQARGSASPVRWPAHVGLEPGGRPAGKKKPNPSAQGLGLMHSEVQSPPPRPKPSPAQGAPNRGRRDQRPQGPAPCQTRRATDPPRAMPKHPDTHQSKAPCPAVGREAWAHQGPCSHTSGQSGPSWAKDRANPRRPPEQGTVPSSGTGNPPPTRRPHWPRQKPRPVGRDPPGREGGKFSYFGSP